MNIKNNRRRRASRDAIENIFIELLQTKSLNEISVSDICKKAGLNRSTFYANYMDIYQLADTIRETLEDNLNDLYRSEISGGYNSNDYLPLFRHIKENQPFYNTYFKLGYDNQYKILKYDTDLARDHFGNRFIDTTVNFSRAVSLRLLNTGFQTDAWKHRRR